MPKLYTNTRNPYHDYRSRCIYLITINKADYIPPFSKCVKGAPGSIPGVKYFEIGRAISEQLRQIPRQYPEAYLKKYIVMPDHIHFIIFITKQVDYHLGEIVSHFKGAVTRCFSYGSIFTEDYHDRICRFEGQLERMKNYVIENPGRWFIRKEGQQYFNNPHLINLYGENYVSYGNFLLLKNPDISSVKVSRKDTAEILASKKKAWNETIRGNGVLVSPFINEEEKVVRDKGMAEGANLIYITRNPITGPRWKPAGDAMTKLCSEGRLLILSTQKGADGSKLSRQEAEKMNLLAGRLSQATPENLILKPISWERR